MNIFEKIQEVKTDILKANLKKSGVNKFAGYKYYELSDFMPTIIDSCKKNKLCTIPSFTAEAATLTAINAEEPTETFIISSPMRNLELKGCNDVQALGGVETYQRRYLYMAMFDITENDMFDGSGEEPPTPKQTPQALKQSDKPDSEDTPEKQLVAMMNRLLKEGKTRDQIMNALNIFNEAKIYTEYTSPECKAAIDFLKVVKFDD